MLSISLTLCCVGLVFSSPAVGNIGHQRQMDENDVFGAQFQPHLADRFKKWERFDIAGRAADFHQDHVHVIGHFAERGFDLIGDMRNHLTVLPR